MRVRTVLLGVFLAGAAWPVAAQEAVDEPAASEVLPRANEIIVTATRREESLLDVPVSVAVTSGDTLNRLALTKAEDLVLTTPGLVLGDSNTPRGAGLRIRGIGTTVFADGIEQSVGTVVDGVPLARAGQGLADLVDVERVEVLRGPQGLLFGRNASAGLINIVTLRPTRDLSARANLSYGTENEVLTAASIAGPIAGEGVRGRLTGYINRRDGFVTNITTGEEYNDRKEYGARGQLLLEPTPDLEVILRGDWSKRDNQGSIWTVRQFATPAIDPRPGTPLLGRFAGPIATGPSAREINNSGPILNEIENYGGSVEVNLGLGDYTLTSLSAYREWQQADTNDADLSPLNVLDRNFGSNELWQVSQELRLTSPAGGLVEFVAGLFFYQSSNRNFSQQIGRFALNLAAAQAAGVNVPLAPGLVLPAAQNFGRDVNTDINVTDYAAFGQATLNVTDQLALIAGARLTRTEVSIDYARTGSQGASGFNFILGAQFAPLAFSAETKDTNLSWRLGAEYALGDNTNIYATVTRGYKGPGYNNLLDLAVPAGVNPAAFTAVAPEIPTNYEIGIKGRTDDGSLTATLAAFRTEFKDFQAQVIEQVPGSPIGSFAIRNAGKLVSQGFELEAAAVPARGLSIGFGLAYTDAEFDSFTGAACPRLGQVVQTVGAPCGPLVAGGPNATFFDASGLPANNAPEFTGNLNVAYDSTLSFAPALRGFAQALYYFRSDTVFGLYPENIPNPTVQDGYGILNAAIGIGTADERLTLSVFGRNLFDKNFVTSIFDLPFDGAGGLGQFVTRDAERTLGVQASLRF